MRLVFEPPQLYLATPASSTLESVQARLRIHFWCTVRGPILSSVLGNSLSASVRPLQKMVTLITTVDVLPHDTDVLLFVFDVYLFIYLSNQ
jgi:hypothetical protein